MFRTRRDPYAGDSWRAAVARACRMACPFVVTLGVASALVPLVDATRQRLHAQPAQTRVVTLPSRRLGEARTLHIHVPANYELAARRYPVVVVLDGQVQAFFSLAVAATQYDLTGTPNGYSVPPQIVVAVEHPSRSIDLAQRDTAFTQFLVNEMLPWLDREFRTLPLRTLIGHSLGGRFALLSLCHAPETFANIVAISPGIADSTVLTRVQQCARAAFTRQSGRVRQIVLSAGALEPRLAAPTATLATFLRDSAPSTWHTLVVNGADLGHTDTPLATIPPGIRAAFVASRWELPVSQSDSLRRGLGNADDMLAAHARRLRVMHGFPVPPSLPTLQRATEHFIARAEPEAAVSAARRLVVQYPEVVISHTLLADAFLLTNDRRNAVEALNAAIRVLDAADMHDREQRQQMIASLQRSLAGIR